MILSRPVFDRWRAALVLTVLVLAPAVAVAQGPQSSSRFAWVNSQLIIRQTPGYAEAESTLNAEIESFRNEVQQMQTQLDSMVRT